MGGALFGNFYHIFRAEYARLSKSATTIRWLGMIVKNTLPVIIDAVNAPRCKKGCAHR